MFPYEKQNLIDYRHTLGWTAAGFCLCLAIGVLLRTYAGWVFSMLQAYAVLTLALRLRDWSPEPAAKRQIVVAMATHAALGIAGYAPINWGIVWYLTR